MVEDNYSTFCYIVEYKIVEYKVDKFIPVSELKQVIAINQKKRQAIQVQIEQLQRELDEI
jgi:hypothetical protein